MISQATIVGTPWSGRGLGERGRSDLVAERSVAEDGVGADQEEVALGRARSAPSASSMSSTFEALRRAAPRRRHVLRRPAPRRCRSPASAVCGAGPHARWPKPSGSGRPASSSRSLELDRDRGGGPLAALQDRLALPPRRAAGAGPARGTCGRSRRRGPGPRRLRSRRRRACSRTSCRPASIERVEQLGGGLERLLADLEQRLDGAARHPAGAVLAIGGQLLDGGGKACHAGSLAAGG